MLPPTHLQTLSADKVIKTLIQLAQKSSKIEKIVLFGSRARGDQRQRSDYDFAIFSFDLGPQERAAFTLRWQDEKPTLLATDLIWVQEPLSKELQLSIQTEGIVIYAKHR